MPSSAAAPRPVSRQPSSTHARSSFRIRIAGRAPSVLPTSAIAPAIPAATITGNVVPVRLFGNNGQITLTATNAANLVSGTDTIPFTQFTRASDNAGFAVPAFSGGTTSPSLVAVGSKITDLTAQWTFAYSNTVNAAPGTYNGEVTYTASMP